MPHQRDMRINHATIDHVFLAPDKIKIPERYVPEAVSKVYSVNRILGQSPIETSGYYV